MRLKNTTNIPNETVREIIQFVRPSGIKNFDVMLRNGKRNRGMAYYQGSGYHATANPFVTINIRPDWQKPFRKRPDLIKAFPRQLRPYQYGQLKGRRYYLASRIEALVYIAAHELRHLWQAKAKNKSGYTWGSKGRFSEIDTESFAINKLRTWRKKPLDNNQSDL